MKIAVEALGIHGFGGGRTATMNLLEGLFGLDHENQYLVILSKTEPSLYTNRGNVKQMIAPIRNRFLLRLWAQAILPSRLRHYDLVHFAKNLGIFGLPMPTVVTMYDMTTLLHADIFPWLDVWYWKNIQKITLEKADCIIAISQATARDIQRFYKIPSGKIRVIYPSINPAYKPIDEEHIRLARSKYKLPENYILHVGRIDRKKNLSLLVDAFARVKVHQRLDGNLKLVLVGEVYYKSQDESIQPTIDRLGLRDDVIFTGNIPDEDLPAVYSGARIFISPSLHEGFGLVAVEAISCGTPVIAHNSGGVEEALGSAALLLDEINIESLTEAMLRYLSDEDLQNRITEAGLVQAKKFNREINALQTLNLYKEIISQ
jgi:glycosyltransferase involved in cell wall biosynthesis